MLGTPALMLRKRPSTSIFAAAILGTIVLWIYVSSNSTPGLPFGAQIWKIGLTHSSSSLVAPVAKYFIDHPLNGPKYGDHFGELGQRIQIITSWLTAAENVEEINEDAQSIENATLSMFPFLRNPSKPDDATPLASLRRSYTPGSRGIVMAVGTTDFRYACHLVLSLREVLHSILPIQIIYAGDADLPPSDRQTLSSLDPTIKFLDILTIFDNNSMKLEKNWAIKPFAALASTFEQVILVDADAVFLQSPELLFSHSGYTSSGALFFHDRLLWKHAFQERHKWWQKQMEHQTPSQQLLKSRVWMEDYAEEADSGVVVLDKRRLSLFTGLLHVSWQNTKAVRDETTYKMTYGDKESWWFGLELCGTPYAFEDHYAAVIGYITEKGGKEDVCGFTIAHVDEGEKLFWFNGSLLKNKHVNGTEYEVPVAWMVDAEWQKGATKKDMSCMVGGSPIPLTDKERELVGTMVQVAEKVDVEKALV